jgi:hypothetical protein
MAMPVPKRPTFTEAIGWHIHSDAPDDPLLEGRGCGRVFFYTRLKIGVENVRSTARFRRHGLTADGSTRHERRMQTWRMNETDVSLFSLARRA